jgi:glycosyltransferase involved in cell wall biosynthesis
VTPLSAVIITHNEEHKIGDALRSVAFCDEVVVVDGGSTDHTRDIALAAGARLVESTPWPGFVAQRNVAVEAARHDWVLAVDADERVTPPLRAEIESLRARGFDAAGYRIPRVAFYLGRWIRGTDWYPDAQLRLFDRTRGRWSGGLIHESVMVDGPVGRLQGDLEHFTYQDVSDHLATIDRYTTLWAQQEFAARHRVTVLHPPVTAAWAFVRNYVVRGGLFLGEAGFTVSTLNSYYTFVKLAKLRELQRGAADALPNHPAASA